MADKRPAILIAEDQIFIALEAERILSERFDCEVEICRRDQLARTLSEMAFDLVVLEFSGNRDEDFQHLTLARQTRGKVVFLTSRSDLADMAERFSDVPLIRKPFNDAEMTRVVESLLMTSQIE